MNIQNRIAKLRHLMKEKNIDAYIIPSADNHQSEYVGDHFKSREFITGFTGSSGTAVITQDSIGLWTDGRYFIQAEKELLGSNITLYKIGTPGVPSIMEYLENILPTHGILGFDGRVISMAEGKKYEAAFSHKNIKLEPYYDLINAIWTNRPPMPNSPIFPLEEKYSGESTLSKLNRIREEMRLEGATIHLLITLDDIAWILNMRGRDVSYTPVFLSYAVITMDCMHLFIDQLKIPNDIKTYFSKNNIVLHPYNDIYSFVQNLNHQETVLIDSSKINYALFSSIPQGIKIIDKMNPSILMKAVKNTTEIENIRKAHVKDAVAHTKFIYWLKTSLRKEHITEISASKKLESLRAEQEHFLWPSFTPISAHGSHAAMCHYSSTPETNVELTPGTFFLTDTGGNYMEGSTDITRTIALGELTQEQKQNYTNVLRGNLALANAKFLHGCTGQNLDILARQFLWNQNLDFKHGTGHGVGYLLSIHEGPCSIRWQHSSVKMPLQEGMILSNEPGLYIENSYGIRLENELLVQKDIQNEYGQFMNFEVITYVPFDLDAIDPSLMNEDEKKLLNNYHRLVFEVVSPYLDDNEKEWLKYNTRAI